MCSKTVVIFQSFIVNIQHVEGKSLTKLIKSSCVHIAYREEGFEKVIKILLKFQKHVWGVMQFRIFLCAHCIKRGTDLKKLFNIN